MFKFFLVEIVPIDPVALANRQDSEIAALILAAFDRETIFAGQRKFAFAMNAYFTNKFAVLPGIRKNSF